MSAEGNLGKNVSLLKALRSDGDGAGDLTIAFGTHATVAASDDNIATGLSEVLWMGGSFKEAPDADPGLVNIYAGTLAGTIQIDTWLAAGTGVATAFGIDVNWFAIGRV